MFKFNLKLPLAVQYRRAGSLSWFHGNSDSDCQCYHCLLVPVPLTLSRHWQRQPESTYWHCHWHCHWHSGCHWQSKLQ